MNHQNSTRSRAMGNIHVIQGKGRVSRPAGTLYEFDEGARISIKDGTHGVAIIGGTGRGKTESFVTPMAKAMIEAGLPGLVIDVKNNFTDRIRRLAAVSGRSGDIVELGTHPSATPVNFLAGLSYPEMEQLFHSLVIAPFEGGRSHNMDFVWRGYQLLCDLGWLLGQLQDFNPAFTPSFALLNRCVTDYEFCAVRFSDLHGKGL